MMALGLFGSGAWAQNPSENETEEAHMYESIMYFSESGPNPNPENIEELIKRGEVIPVKVRWICYRRPRETKPCSRIVYLDKIIPVNPQPKDDPQ